MGGLWRPIGACGGVMGPVWPYRGGQRGLWGGYRGRGGLQESIGGVVRPYRGRGGAIGAVMGPIGAWVGVGPIGF